MNIAVDQLAERLLAVGGQPIATMKEYIGISTIQETAKKPKSTEMVATLVQDYSQIKARLVELAESAESNNDTITNDLAISLIEQIDTHL